MPLLRVSEWRTALAIAAIPYLQPLSPRAPGARTANLGDAYVETGTVIRARPGAAIGEIFPHVWQLHDRTQKLVDSIRGALEKGRRATPHDLQVYEDLAPFLLYHRFLGAFETRVQGSTGREIPTGKVSFWDDFKKQFHELFHVPGQHAFNLCARGNLRGVLPIRASLHPHLRSDHRGLDAGRAIGAAVWDSIFMRDLSAISASCTRRWPTYRRSSRVPPAAARSWSPGRSACRASSPSIQAREALHPARQTCTSP